MSGLRRVKVFVQTWMSVGLLALLLEYGLSVWSNSSFRLQLRALTWPDLLIQLGVLSLWYGLASALGGALLALLFVRPTGGETADNASKTAAFSALLLIPGVYLGWLIRYLLLSNGMFSLWLWFLCWILGLIALWFGLRMLRVKRFCLPAWVVLGILLLMAGVKTVPLGTAAGAGQGPNVLLVTWDTVRASDLESSGGQALTPQLSALAARGVSFSQAHCQVPLTVPSHASLLTGLYPHTNGSVSNFHPLPSPQRTLAEILKDQGYATAAVLSGYTLKDRLANLSQGFDLYNDRFGFLDGFKLLRASMRLDWQGYSYSERLAPQTTELARAWLEDHGRDGGGPFFLWVHYFDAHTPYHPPGTKQIRQETGLTDRVQLELAGQPLEAVGESRARIMKQFYLGELALMDAELGRLLQALDENASAKNTVIAVVADHGEGFAHDYYFDHGDRVYEEQVHVPLVFCYAPHFAGGEVRSAGAGLVDVAPTILDLLGLQSEAGRMQGRSLLRSGAGPLADRAIFGDCPERAGFHTLGPLEYVKLGPWKLIQNRMGGAVRLFNLDEDPEELVDQASQHPEMVEELSKQLRLWRLHALPAESLATGSLSSQDQEHLRSLGYLH
ncbi:MAG: sulfatase-like hydrolase/transferase [Candidatus Omnitrophica bacterium]|nr:sulfatase-like hydrolase/transferase [Candidatus Omnitrophota bacterium]